MARKEITWTVEENNRDKGKTFFITEMSAWEAEELAQEIYRAMGTADFGSIPTDVIAMGCAGLATLGLSVLSATSTEMAASISSRLLSTVKISVDTGYRDIKPFDFEEVSTIRTLKDKVFELNFGFLTLAAR
ncbi:hypothetical protein [Candidatus Arsenophonus triatominarum]|uniref:hypothetical protein n=1 Tax=Candidatus Arsenophonus triatominarum TaxID=57911 RepID=UPI0007C55324|nr:hypothetical protein [Candidatus Arsenophonus triatominarum]